MLVFSLADTQSTREPRARPESAKPAAKDYKTVMDILVTSGLHFQLFILDI
jgi:hypothetical protein